MSTRLDFNSVTEVTGELITKEQLDRMLHRYHFASLECRDKDVLEIACGVGQGAGLLSNEAKSYIGIDIDSQLVGIAELNNQDCKFITGDATKLEMSDNSIDVIIIFEALYYFPDVFLVLLECKRVLRPDGVLLISQANPDLYDFNPSPFSFKYFSVSKMEQVLKEVGFTVMSFGYLDTKVISLRQKIFRPIKRLAVLLKLMPKTMAGKRFLKRIVFGSGIKMPGSLRKVPYNFGMPKALTCGTDDSTHKVLYFKATAERS